MQQGGSNDWQIQWRREQPAWDFLRLVTVDILCPDYYALEASAEKLLKRLFFRKGRDFKKYLQS